MTKRSKTTGKSLKNKKDGGRVEEKLFDFFWKFSSRCIPVTGSGQNERKTKSPGFIVFLCLKDFGGFKGRREMSRFQVVSFAISSKFGFNISAKVYARENPYTDGEFLFFLFFFLRENPMKSDKLALIEFKILNLMFLDSGSTSNSQSEAKNS